MPRGVPPGTKPPGAALQQKQPAAPGGGLSIPVFNPGSFSGAGAADTGVRKYTPGDIANMQANAAAQLGAGLTGPFTPEAEASGYASMVAQFYGVNHPAAQKWVSYAQARNWDAATFGRWLRTRPEFKSTDVGRRMTADILAVVSSIFRGT